MNRFQISITFAAVAVMLTTIGADADAQLRRATQARADLAPTCESKCVRQEDQRACVSACYRDNYRRQQLRATTRLRSIADLNDQAYEDDIRRNPDLSVEAKSAILAQKAEGFDVFRIPNRAPGGTGPGDIPVEQGPVGIAPLKLVTVSYGTGAGSQTNQCGAGACQLGKLYDLPAQWLTLSYRLTGISAAEVREHINRVAFRRIDLSINNVKLVQGKSVIHGDNYLVIALEEPCYYGGQSTDGGCMIFAIDPDLFFPAYPPYPNWAVDVQLSTIRPQIGPVNPTAPVKRPRLQKTGMTLSSAAPKSAQPRTQPESQRAIEATPDITQPGQSTFSPRDDFTVRSYIVPPAFITSYWLETIGQSVSSERCTSCHAMDTQAKIHDHHQGIEGQIVMVPSALIPGQQVHSCSNCHACGPEKCSGGPLGGFGENRWATPTQTQNINWAALINANPSNWPAVVCQRMKTTLNTPQLREEHFHEDFRLFWAVADGVVIGPGGGQLETAPPHSYSAFLSRFDIWNAAGAPCPPG